jgi:organic radical activating enzyme
VTKTQLKSFTVICGNRCSANCTDCFTESSRHWNNWISEQTIYEIEEWLGNNPPPEHFSITGGEPTLNLSILHRLLNASNSAHKRIVTNGSWGKNKNYAGKVLDVLNKTGVERVQISLGEAHSPWVNFNTVSLAIEEILNNSSCSIELLLEYMNKSFLHEIQHFIDSMRKNDFERITLYAFQWSTRSNDFYLYTDPYLAEPQGYFCDQLLAPRIIIDHDGSVYRCCGTHIRIGDKKQSPYYLGSIGSDFIIPFSESDCYSSHFQKLNVMSDEKLKSIIHNEQHDWNRLHPCSKCKLYFETAILNPQMTLCN